MTQKLYYDDAYLQTFTARVEERRRTKRGPAVRLDRTAFYPTSGGQPHDTGSLDGLAVVDVWVDDEGEVWHLLDGEPQVDELRGAIDWDRRFDHMQQHTGQHLLSAAFMRHFEAPTVGFHLGSKHCTIDLDLPRLSPEAAFRVEEEVNAILWDDRPVETRFVTDAELEALALRREPQVEGNARVVSVEGYDATPCGGTHVARTGEIGQLKITGLERYKGGVRVSFLCGKRALRDYRRVLRLAQELGTDLTVAQDEVPEAVGRLQEELKETRRALNRAQSRLLDTEAERLWEAASGEEGVKHVVGHWPERPFSEVQELAARLRQRPETLVLLAAGRSEGVRLVCARSADLGDVDAVALLREALDALGGRGGGSPEMAQGGAPPAPPEDVRQALEKALLMP